MKEKKILLSGVQPSGAIHIGNYFGAIKEFITLVNSGNFESYIFVADYHSMTTLTNKEERLKNTFDLVATYLACGLNPKKANIFKQSDVQDVAELAWIFNTVTPIPMLFLAHSFKDKAGQSREEKLDLENLKEINAGLFDYPVLMAADILLYNADIVPVGKDQLQHIEYARDIAGKYNRAYKTDTFKSPESLIKKDVATVIGIDGEAKMSKSKNNFIPMFASSEEIKKKIMSIKTDSKLPDEKKNPDEVVIYQLHKLFLSSEEDRKLRERFLNSDKNPYSYKEAKDDLLETVEKYFREMRKKYEYYTNTKRGRKEVFSVMKSGAKKANKRASIMMKKIRKETGLDF